MNSGKSEARNSNFDIRISNFQMMDALDLERANFLAWYRTATPDDLARARAHGAEKLDELLAKYAGEVKIIAAINGVAQASRLQGIQLKLKEDFPLPPEHWSFNCSGGIRRR